MVEVTSKRTNTSRSWLVRGCASRERGAPPRPGSPTPSAPRRRWRSSSRCSPPVHCATTTPCQFHADLLARLGRRDEAVAELTRAASLAQNHRARDLLLRRAADLSQKR